MSGIKDIIPADLREDYPRPEVGVIYCVACMNLSAVTYIRFFSPGISNWEDTPEAREFNNHIIAPGYESVIQMDKILCFIQAKDPTAFLMMNGVTKASVRACMIVNGFALCAIDGGEMYQQWARNPVRYR